MESLVSTIYFARLSIALVFKVTQLSNFPLATNFQWKIRLFIRVGKLATCGGREKVNWANKEEFV